MVNDLKDIRILFADDDIYFMRPTIDALEAYGAVVDIVRDGSSVLKYIRENQGSPPSLLILDIMMSSGPEISTDNAGRSTGLAVYRHIRQNLKVNIPIVVSTVVTDSAMLSVFKNDPKAQIINKPYTFGELLNIIKKMLVMETKK